MGDLARDYPTTPMPATSPSPRPPSSLSWLWIVLAILLVLGLGCAGLCAGLWFVGRSTVQKVQEAVTEGMQSVVPYQLAWERVQQAPQVTARLGQPLAAGFPGQFQMQESGTSGSATFAYDVSGPKGRATVRVEAERVDGQWRFRVLRVTFPDGQTVDLSDSDVPIRLDENR